MADVKWIKITTDIFDPDSKLFAIETLPDGHMIELVWFKLLILTGKLNHNGFIINSAKIPYTDEMLSQAFRIDLGTIKRSIEIFESFGMIEVVDNTYMISNWLMHQNEKGLEDYKKAHADAQKRYRDKQKSMKEIPKKESDITRDSHSDIISSYSISYSLYISNIINYLNNKCNTNYKSNTKNTIKHIKARLDEGYKESDFYSVIDYKASQWLNDPKMSDYLRPDTLFGSKFESYLQSAPKNNQENVVVEEKHEEPTDYGWED